MIDALTSAASRALAAGRPWSGLPGDALAWVLAGLADEGRWLVVVDEPDLAERMTRALRFFHPRPREVEPFPADDCRPYDGFSPDPEIPAQRARALNRVGRGGPVVVVAPAAALLRRIPDAPTRAAGTRVIRPEDILERDALLRWLTDAGYLAVPRVSAPGTFAVRGDVVDVWGAGTAAPRRIDFFDELVEAVRMVDPETGRSAGPAKRALLLPAREERIDAAAIDRFHHAAGRQAAAQGRGLGLRRRLLEELKAGIRFAGVEEYLPALVPTAAPLEELAGLRTVVVDPDGVRAALRELERSAQRRWSELDDEERPLVPPAERYVALDEVLSTLATAHPVYEIAAEGATHLGASAADGFAVRGAELGPLANRIAELAREDARVVLVADGERRAETLTELLEPHGVHPTRVGDHRAARPGEVSLVVGDLARGFVAPGLAFLPAGALFGGERRSHRDAALHQFFDGSVSNLSQLRAGDLVVHRVHGIGRFMGLNRLTVHGVEQDFLRLEYRAGDAMYLPATSLGELSRYDATRSGVKAELDRLGGVTWERRKGKVRDSLLRRAQELLDLHARRELTHRDPLPPPGEMFHAFEARFLHDETPDQLSAIAAIGEDLSGDAPMDRLVCGDVGFGKTEVAMRAAMRMVEAGYQVAVLCPTTVLAFQHHLTFQDRFAGFPTNTAMLSRFSSGEEEAEVLAGLASGAVDVVIGTTRLLGRGVRFRNLGLLVIDEEHRFGVRQKDRLKRFRTEVDILCMSATPIPRTLQMALAGARDMSVIATPPTDRLSVRTSVGPFTRTRVRDAVLQEMARGGQVFFVHNRIESIEGVADGLREWLPEARIQVAHGQMGDEDLERVLVDFMQRRFDVLVCTAIVESGVDLPNVNTMIVHRADLFGLSQLYQLRGRVGRSSVRGQCLLLVPDNPTREASRRLRVLVENTRLGSGFAVAAADLELRGGGNLLGAEQSGHIDAVGYEVWLELLEEAVHHAQGLRDRDRIEPEIEIPSHAFLPDVLFPEVPERLGWYRRFSDARTGAEVDALIDELEDRFRDLPEEVHNLAGLVLTRLSCRNLGVIRLTWMKVRVVLELHPSSKLSEAKLGALVISQPKRMTLERAASGAPVLSVRFTPKEAERPFHFLRWLFARLEAHQAT